MNQTVMIADDAPFMRTILRTILEIAGYTVVAEAADGAEAVAMYLEFRPAISLMDTVMPGKSGIEAAWEISSHDAGAKVVMCCLPGQEALITTPSVSRVWDVIVKPYKSEEVLDVVQRVAPR